MNTATSAMRKGDSGSCILDEVCFSTDAPGPPEGPVKKLVASTCTASFRLERPGRRKGSLSRQVVCPAGFTVIEGARELGWDLELSNPNRRVKG